MRFLPATGYLLATFAIARASFAQPPISPASPVRNTRPSRCRQPLTYDQIVQTSESTEFATSNATADPFLIRIAWNEREDDPVDDRTAAVIGECYQVTHHSTTVTVSGVVTSQLSDSSGMRGGSGTLPPEALRHLLPVLDHLPADEHRVPLPMLTVVTFLGGKPIVRLYDSDHLSDEMLTAARLIGIGLPIVIPKFVSNLEWPKEQVESSGWPAKNSAGSLKKMGGGMSAISIDGTKVEHSFVTKTLNVLSPSGQTLRVIPEFWQAGTGYGGYAVGVEFSPDGRSLLVRSHGAFLYDTATWKPITDPKLFPQSILHYFPSEDWSVGLAIAATGEVTLWDERLHRPLSTLDGIDGKEIRRVVFLRGRRQVAIWSEPSDRYRPWLSTWDIRTGKMIHEFWQGSSSSSLAPAPIWWNDGRWLVSGGEGGGTLAVWDASTGRFLGELATPSSVPETCWDPLVIANNLLRQCSTGRVVGWSVEAVQQQLDQPKKK